jgi:lipoate-protein ligase B
MIKNTQRSNMRTPGEQPEPRPHKLPSIQNLKSKIQNPKLKNAQRDCWCIDLGTMDYRKAWKLQTDIVAARNHKIIDADMILMLEHHPVFTLGRRGGSENLLVSETFLEQAGVALTQVERGGNITYHGPGQLVVYPIIDLEAARISVVEFVEALELVMLRTVETWGINAERNSVNRGIWVADKKMGSIGIALRKGISFHGLALNVNPDLTPFSWIQPCGLQGVSMTSMEQEVAGNISLSEVRNVLKKEIELVFQISLLPKGEVDLKEISRYEMAEQ